MNVARNAAGAVEYRVKGRTVAAAELKGLLFGFAEQERARGDRQGPSELVVLIRCDRDLPFRAVRRVLDACMAPEVRIERIELGVLVAGGSLRHDI